MWKIDSRCLIILSLIWTLSGCTGNKKADSSQESLDSLSDDSLLTLVQYRTFQYFWDGAEPVSGMARERIHIDGIYPENDQTVVTTGGTGFGLMAILVAIERGFITREDGIKRLAHIIEYLGKADRFHGAWPHWIEGTTGKVKPFGSKDDGGDIVETAYLAQGLLCVKQYFNQPGAREQALSGAADSLWRGIEWNWYRNNLNVIYWHWSPNYQWEMNFPIHGYNECLITYVLAGSSPDHGIPAEVYHQGWARGGDIITDVTSYGYKLALKHNGAEKFGGPLFWAHYSYLGLDPRGLKDLYADYWEHNRNHVLINRQHCLENPGNYKGYGKNCWGLTASYSIRFYAAHSPAGDLGVISPTAALSSFPYTPEYSMNALEYFYYELGDRLWGPYGFYDAFSIHDDWFTKKYLAIDQGPIVVMIENYRSGLLWKLFMSAPEVKMGLAKLGFTSPVLQ
ncbi:MAG TPA: glucoamylase family protein [Cyclobacteriaceae bacterium]|nr:glucoamylase family protein [Cyclobacteriaceae bacterium]